VGRANQVDELSIKSNTLINYKIKIKRNEKLDSHVVKPNVAL
jgi:hypothetical protein